VIPICSCGVVPVVTGLIAGGVPLAPAVAFLVAAPMMNPATYTMTAGALGADIAASRLVGALALSIAAGFVALALERAGWIRPDRDLRPVRRVCPCAWDAGAAPAGARRFLLAWLRGGEILIGFARYIAIGIAIGAAIGVLVRPEWVGRWFAGAVGVPAAALLGVPLYLCTCSEIPVSLPLLAKGMSKAALIAFLLAGPGVSVFSLVLIGSLFGKRLIVLYAGGFLIGSMLLGWIAGLALGG
ncbi:MAG: permease, partial [Planctomycetes bacterium]|nr:permease [Planctomycetota bacterium]